MTSANKGVCGTWSVVRLTQVIAVAKSGVAEPKCVVNLQKQADTGRPKGAVPSPWGQGEMHTKQSNSISCNAAIGNAASVGFMSSVVQIRSAQTEMSWR